MQASAGLPSGKTHDNRRRAPYFYLRNAAFYQGRAMGAQLNIKSEDAYHIASQLSELTGESLTAVVTRALRTELDRELRARDIEAKVARMLAARERNSCASAGADQFGSQLSLRRERFSPVIVDASALLAIVLDEPDAERYARAIARPAAAHPIRHLVRGVDANGGGRRAMALSRFDEFPKTLGSRSFPSPPVTPRWPGQGRRLYGCRLSGRPELRRLPGLWRREGRERTPVVQGQ